MIRAETTTVIAAPTCKATSGAKAMLGAAERRLSTDTRMLTQMLHFLSIYSPAAASRPPIPSTKPK
jgi:hypothetical protein